MPNENSTHLEVTMATVMLMPIASTSVIKTSRTTPPRRLMIVQDYWPSLNGTGKSELVTSSQMSDRWPSASENNLAPTENDLQPGVSERNIALTGEDWKTWQGGVS